LLRLGKCLAPGTAKDNLHITAFDIKRLTFCDFNKELEVGRALFSLSGNPAITSSGRVFVKDVDPI
jgi:hypothetical protein